MSRNSEVENKRDKVVVIGSTGACGKWVVDELLNSPEVEEVISLVRRPNVYEYPHNSSKLKEVVLSDDLDKDLRDHFPTDASSVFACVGTTIGQAGSQEAFRAVDFGVNTKIAQAAKANNVSQFHLISAVGAATDSFVFYSRVKGETEEFIEDLNFPHFAIYRPAGLDSPDRASTRWNETIGIAMSRLFNWFDSPDSSLGKYAPIHVRDVAIAMVDDYSSTRKDLEKRQKNLSNKLILDGSMSIIHRARAVKQARGEPLDKEWHLKRSTNTSS